MIIRYINPSEGHLDVSEVIQEHFNNFLEVQERTGKHLLVVLLLELKRLGLNIADIRGQGYDNGANMKGHKSGVHIRLLQLNPTPFFYPWALVPVTEHLLLCDMAKLVLMQ